MGRGFLDVTMFIETSSRSNMQRIPMMPHRWHPSESPASLSQRLFCLRQALHALDALDLLYREITVGSVVCGVESSRRRLVGFESIPCAMCSGRDRPLCQRAAPQAATQIRLLLDERPKIP